jgi:hypothetical protein
LTVNFKEQPQHKANLRLVQKQQQKKHETLKVCAVALSQQPVWSTEVTAQRRDPESENPELEGIFSCVLAHFLHLVHGLQCMAHTIPESKEDLWSARAIPECSPVISERQTQVPLRMPMRPMSPCVACW